MSKTFVGNDWPTFNSAVEAILERFDDETPDSEAQAMEDGHEALTEYIDSRLVYTFDILELWDGSTHEEVYINGDIMDAITQSTFLQLQEEWNDAIYDALEHFIDSRCDALDIDKDSLSDGDEQLEAITHQEAL